MIRTARHMLTCHWTARRLQRYLDADRSAPLEPHEVARLEEHLATCERCSRALAEHRLLRRVLGGLGHGTPVRPESVDRMRSLLDELTSGTDGGRP